MYLKYPERLPTLEKLTVDFGASLSITAKHETEVLATHLPYISEKECFVFKQENELVKGN